MKRNRITGCNKIGIECEIHVGETSAGKKGLMILILSHSIWSKKVRSSSDEKAKPHKKVASPDLIWFADLRKKGALLTISSSTIITCHHQSYSLFTFCPPRLLYMSAGNQIRWWYYISRAAGWEGWGRQGREEITINRMRIQIARFVSPGVGWALSWHWHGMRLWPLVPLLTVKWRESLVRR